MARAFGLTVGDPMTWQFDAVTTTKSGLPDPKGHPLKPTRTTFRVAAIVDVSPALVGTFDTVETAILPPAATTHYLRGGWNFGWASLRLRDGAAGIPELRRQLGSLGPAIANQGASTASRSASQSGGWISSSTGPSRPLSHRQRPWRFSAGWRSSRCLP